MKEQGMRTSRSIRDLLRPTAGDTNGRKLLDSSLRKPTNALEEQIKEQKFIYSISCLLGKQDIPLDKRLQELVGLIPSAWHYPEITCARIILRGQEFRTENFRETDWKQTSTISVRGEPAGEVEVCYLEEKPDADENPFLTEKRELLDAIAMQVGMVAESKQAEEVLRQREREYRLLLDCTLDGLAIIDIETAKVVFCNQRAAMLFGFNSPGETTGVTSLGLIHPEDRDRIIKTVAEEVFEKGPHETHEFHAITKDGRDIRVKAVFTIMEYQERLALAATLKHRPEQKEGGSGTSILDEELEQRVAERTWQLQAVNKELEAFAYSVSHDLRAPLRSIEGFSQVLLEDYAHWLDTQGRDYLQRICSASRRMAQLIDALLNFSRVTRVEMQRDKVDLSALACAIAAELQQSQPERQVEFIITPGLVANGDSHLLRVALENLLGNAWKFTRKRPKTRIEFGNIEKEGQTIYFVRDNGVGFDMAYADKLFSGFQRLHSPAEYEGTGIGLTTVKRVVERHGGSIWADSVLEQGATFYFTL
jgi:PAS domain S-box-containing protein